MRKVGRVHHLADRNTRSMDRKIGFSSHHMYLAFFLAPQMYTPVDMLWLSRSAFDP